MPTDSTKARHGAHRDAQRADGRRGISIAQDSRSGYSLPRAGAGRTEKPRRSRQALPGLCVVWCFMVKPWGLSVLSGELLQSLLSALLRFLGVPALPLLAVL